MNCYYTITICRNGQVSTIDTPRGIVDLDDALSAIGYLQPFDLVSWTKND